MLPLLLLDRRMLLVLRRFLPLAVEEPRPLWLARPLLTVRLEHSITLSFQRERLWELKGVESRVGQGERSLPVTEKRRAFFLFVR